MKPGRFLNQQKQKGSPQESSEGFIGTAGTYRDAQRRQGPGWRAAGGAWSFCRAEGGQGEVGGLAGDRPLNRIIEPSGWLQL